MVVAFPALDVISQHLYTVGARYLLHIFPTAGTFTSVMRESRRSRYRFGHHIVFQVSPHICNARFGGCKPFGQDQHNGNAKSGTTSLFLQPVMIDLYTPQKGCIALACGAESR